MSAEFHEFSVFGDLKIIFAKYRTCRDNLYRFNLLNHIGAKIFTKISGSVKFTFDIPALYNT